jgi:hypothetical protein
VPCDERGDDRPSGGDRAHPGERRRTRSQRPALGRPLRGRRETLYDEDRTTSRSGEAERWRMSHGRTCTAWSTGLVLTVERRSLLV